MGILKNLAWPQSWSQTNFCGDNGDYFNVYSGMISHWAKLLDFDNEIVYVLYKFLDIQYLNDTL